MATYYVDLNSNSNPGSSGTEGSPFGWAQFQALQPDGFRGHTFYLKGIRSSSIDINCQNGVTFKGWKKDEIWRLSLSGLTGAYAAGNSISIENGFLKISWFIGNGEGGYFNINAKNSIFWADYYFRSRSTSNSLTFTGSTAYFGFYPKDEWDSLHFYFQDSIIQCWYKGNYTNCATDSYFRNCAFTDSSFETLFTQATKINNQFTYTPPTWPTFTALRSDFDSSLLSIGLNSPPLPGYGSPTYPDYNFGLYFDKRRSGIGAMDFPNLITCWDYTAKYKGSNRMFKLNGPGLFPKELKVPGSVDVNTGVMIDEGKLIDPSMFKIIQ